MMGCPCCEDRDDDWLDEEGPQPGDNHAAFTAGAVAYPSAGGPQYSDRQRHAAAAKRRGAATSTVVTGLPLGDYLPVLKVESGPIQYRFDGEAG